MDDDEWEKTGSSGKGKSGYSLSGLWSSYGWSGYGRNYSGISNLSQEQLQQVGFAHKMTQRFVDSFAGASRYKVTFSGASAPAKTDPNEKTIYLSARPVLDKDLTAEESGEILTGLAVHEILHSRYGEGTRRAVTKTWPKDNPENERAHLLANYLDDVRIERAFVEEYPGYDTIFDPVRAYVAKVETAEAPDKKYHPKIEDQLDCASLAIRYPEFTVWDTPEVKAEGEWWADWAKRWANADSPEAHVKAVTEGLAHLTTPPPAPQGEGEGEGEGEPEEDSAHKGGCYSLAKTDTEKSLSNLGDIVQDLEGLAFGKKDNRRYDQGMGRVTFRWPQKIRVPHINPRASAIIKATLMRSRTGTTEIERRQKMGRLDNRVIHEIAWKSSRLFTRSISPSPGRYLVWVLIDQSGSMSGAATDQTIGVAEAVAAATRDLTDLRMDIFSWSTGDPFGKGSVLAGWYIARVWTSGQPVGYIATMRDVHGSGGTPDSAVLGWSVNHIRDYVKNGEQPIILMLSDGQGDEWGMRTAVDDGLKRGVRVISVAIGGLDADSQERIYGKGNFIPWRGSIVATAKPLANLLGKLVGAS